MAAFPSYLKVVMFVPFRRPFNLVTDAVFHNVGLADSLRFFRCVEGGVGKKH
jgi:hypothetical protein